MPRRQLMSRTDGERLTRSRMRRRRPASVRIVCELVAVLSLAACDLTITRKSDESPPQQSEPTPSESSDGVQECQRAVLRADRVMDTVFTATETAVDPDAPVPNKLDTFKDDLDDL